MTREQRRRRRKLRRGRKQVLARMRAGQMTDVQAAMELCEPLDVVRERFVQYCKWRNTKMKDKLADGARYLVELAFDLLAG